MKRILVTGANGFIGQHLLKTLSKEPNMVVAITRQKLKNVYELLYNAHDGFKFIYHTLDLKDELDIIPIMREYQPDLIYHLAAHSTPSTESEDKNTILEDNIIGTNNLLKNCPKYSHFVFTSSIVVYGNKCKLSTNEDQKLTPTSIYGASKAACEELINVYAEQKKITSCCLRLCAVVGTGLTHGLILDVLKKLHSSNQTLKLIGDEPGTCKPYLHVDDAVNALVLAQSRADTYNVLTCYPITVLEVVNTVMETLNKYKPIEWSGKQSLRPWDNQQLIADNQKILNEGWNPRFLLSEGAIRATIKEIQNDRIK